MRNLKKILALVLALVMTFSVMATANAFTDDSQIDATYDEAVTVLSNLGVFEGYENGSFQPKGSITRAEVAAIIYRVVTGDVDDKQVSIYADYNKFSDVKSTSWYAGYVNFCANAEYIKGYGNGKFGPQDKVTGYQALAMILRAIGYDKNGEFTGANWQVQTAAVGKKLGVTDNVSAGTLNTAATREVVAEILFQTIATAPQVEYTVAFGYQSISLSNGRTNTLGEETFGLAQITGEVVAVDNCAGSTTLTEVEKNNVLSTAAADTTVVVGTDADFGKIGYGAYVWAVKTSAAKTYTAVSDVVVTSNSLKVTTDGTEIAKSKVTLDTGVRYYLNGKTSTAAAVEAIDGQVGVKIDYIDNDNGGKAEVIVATQYTVATVTGIATDINAGINATTAKSYYLNHKAVAEKNLITNDTLAYNDLVTYVEYKISDTHSDYYVTKVPYTTDVFTQIYRSLVSNAQSYNYAYTIGGADYYKAYAYLNAQTDVLVQANLQKTVVIGTDPYGYILTASLYANPNAYLFVVENDQTRQLTALTETYVVFSDGQTAEVNVNKLVKADKTTQTFFSATGDNDYNKDSIAPHIYAYTEKDSVYTLTDAGCQTLSGVNYVAGKAQFGTLGLDSKSVVVDLRTGKVGTVYTGHTGENQVPSLTNATIHYLASANGVITLAYLTNGTNSTDLSAEFIAYKTTYNKVLGSAADGYTYLVDVLVDGEVKTAELTAAQYNALMTYGVGHYVFSSTGVLTFTAFTEEWVDALWANNTVKVGTSTFYPYGEVPFYVLNIGKETATPYTMTSGSDGVFTGINNTAKAYITYDKKGNVTAIYVIADENNLATVSNPDAIMVKNGKTLTYNVETKKITNAVDTTAVNPADYLSSAVADGIKGTIIGGSGTQADPFKLTAVGCLNGQTTQLVVTAVKTNQEIKIYHQDADVKASGKGIVTEDSLNEIAATTGNTWNFTIEGVYFQITVTGLSHETKLTSSNANVVVAENGNVTVNSTYAGEGNFDYTKVLSAPTGASIVSYANKTLTVKAECGHTETYTVTFVEKSANEA